MRGALVGQGAPWWVREIHADHAYKEGFYLKRGDGKGGKGAAVGEPGLWGQEPCKERERQRERERETKTCIFRGWTSTMPEC